MMSAWWPASRSARASERAITMWPPSTIGGLDVTTAMRLMTSVVRAPTAERRTPSRSSLQRRLHANAEEARIRGGRLVEHRHEARAARHRRGPHPPALIRIARAERKHEL